MGATIHWRVHIRTGDDAARQRVLARVAGVLGAATEVASIDRDPRDHRDHVAVLRTRLDSPDAAAGVLDTFTVAGSLCHGWYTGGPQVEPDGSWTLDLSATADDRGRGFVVLGVVFAVVSAAGGPGDGG